MKVVFKQIQDENTLDQYLARFEDFVKVKLPRAYFEASYVVGCFDENNKLVGGYTIATQIIRGLAILPDTVKADSDFLKTVPASEMVEVNGLWMDKSMNTVEMKGLFWGAVVADIQKTKREFLLLWYNSAIPHLTRLYSMVGLEKIYDGPVFNNTGVQSHKSVYVGYVAVTSIKSALTKFKVFYFFRKVKQKFSFSSTKVDTQVETRA